MMSIYLQISSHSYFTVCRCTNVLEYVKIIIKDSYNRVSSGKWLIILLALSFKLN